MFKSEKGNTYINWVIWILALLILAGITIRVLVGEDGLINQKREEMVRKNSEKNIVIELTNSVE
ncbi:MAG: hypothetical protein IKE01_06250 [Clostridia bacterium]|nr:hypothetical protein [Clostridia bacterium]